MGENKFKTKNLKIQKYIWNTAALRQTVVCDEAVTDIRELTDWFGLARLYYAEWQYYLLYI